MNIWNDKLWRPMLLKEIKKPFNSKDYFFELKFDGQRAIVFASPKKVIVKNRHGEDISYLFPELQNIKKLVKNNVIFDGEIVSFKDGLPSFSKLQERTHLKNKEKIENQSKENPIIFVCFDILYDNKDLTTLKLIERKKILNNYSDNDVFLKNKFIDTYGIDLFKYIKKMNLEGIIAKEKDSNYYINKRSNVWLKIKNLNKESFFIGGYIKSSKTNIISLLLGEKRNNELHFVGKVSLHEKNILYKIILKKKTIKNSPFIDYNKDVNYLNPTLKCHVEYLERTKNKHLRQPIFRDE